MNTIERFFERPFSFIARQLYRVCVVIPFVSLVSLWYVIWKKNINLPLDHHRICVVITSVIHISHKRLNYAERRSLFDPRERLEQTKKTIDSIRQYIPKARIIFVEGGGIKNHQNSHPVWTNTIMPGAHGWYVGLAGVKIKALVRPRFFYGVSKNSPTVSIILK